MSKQTRYYHFEDTDIERIAVSPDDGACHGTLELTLSRFNEVYHFEFTQQQVRDLAEAFASLAEFLGEEAEGLGPFLFTPHAVEGQAGKD